MKYIKISIVLIVLIIAGISKMNTSVAAEPTVNLMSEVEGMRIKKESPRVSKEILIKNMLGKILAIVFWVIELVGVVFAGMLMYFSGRCVGD